MLIVYIISFILIFPLFILYRNMVRLFFAEKIIIIQTKIGFLKWKKRLFVESFISTSEEKYKTKVGKKEYRLLKTCIVFPSSCVVDVYVKNKFKRRYENCYTLYNYLEKCKTEPYIPQYVLDNPSIWQKDKLNMVREIKFRRLFKDDLR